MSDEDHVMVAILWYGDGEWGWWCCGCQTASPRQRGPTHPRLLLQPSQCPQLSESQSPMLPSRSTELRSLALGNWCGRRRRPAPPRTWSWWRPYSAEADCQHSRWTRPDNTTSLIQRRQNLHKHCLKNCTNYEMA